MEEFRKKRQFSNLGSQFGEIKEFPVEEFEWFIKKVKESFGLDLTGYKPHRVKRRIEMLIRKYSLSSYKEYYELLLKDNKKKEEFFDRLTINVTEFFRNPEKWWELRDRFLPKLLSERKNKFKAWSAGCSSGEEPYSLAILLEELKAPIGAKVLATDLDIGVLNKARLGKYEERSLVSTPQSYINKYFELLDSGKFMVKPSVKARVKFKQHNLLQDPFEKDFDIIICRNVVIYFELHAKEILYKKFAESLRSGGLLFVGSTERIFNYKQIGLTVVSPFIYQKL
ncbi:CheR family methyltransferase [Thermosipho ferrireducens]|uniref:CheR family methyltransferase n=1 Tax=Thermosipho ferrireducens TaxID=2571116 RepID=UPI00389B0A85